MGKKIIAYLLLNNWSIVLIELFINKLLLIHHENCLSLLIFATVHLQYSRPWFIYGGVEFFIEANSTSIGILNPKWYINRIKTGLRALYSINEHLIKKTQNVSQDYIKMLGVSMTYPRMCLWVGVWMLYEYKNSFKYLGGLMRLIFNDQKFNENIAGSFTSCNKFIFKKKKKKQAPPQIICMSLVILYISYIWMLEYLSSFSYLFFIRLFFVRFVYFLPLL